MTTKEQVKKSKLFKQHGFDLIDIFEKIYTTISKEDCMCTNPVWYNEGFLSAGNLKDRTNFLRIFEPTANEGYWYPFNEAGFTQRKYILKRVISTLKEIKNEI